MSIQIYGAPAEWLKDCLSDKQKADACCESFSGGDFIVFLDTDYAGMFFTRIPWWPSCWHYQANHGGNATASSAATKWGAIRECRRWLNEQSKRNGEAGN